MNVLKLFCGIPNWFVDIFSEEKSILELLKYIYRNLTCNYPKLKERKNVFIIRIQIQEGYLYVSHSYNVENSFKCSDLTEVVYLTYHLIEYYTHLFPLNNCSIFHGGLIEKDNHVYGISAPTRTGKSTLIAYLCTKGYRFLADDYIFIDSTTYDTYSFELPITLRSKKYLPQNANKNIVFEGYNKYKSEKNYLFTNISSGEISNSLKIKKMLFICRCDQNEFHLLSNGESYKRLLLNLKNDKTLDIEITKLINFTKGISCISVFYKDMDYVKNLIEQET